MAKNNTKAKFVLRFFLLLWRKLVLQNRIKCIHLLVFRIFHILSCLFKTLTQYFLIFSQLFLPILQTTLLDSPTTIKVHLICLPQIWWIGIIQSLKLALTLKIVIKISSKCRCYLNTLSQFRMESKCFRKLE